MTVKEIEQMLTALFAPIRERVNQYAAEAKPRVWDRIKARMGTPEKRELPEVRRTAETKNDS